MWLVQAFIFWLVREIKLKQLQDYIIDQMIRNNSYADDEIAIYRYGLKTLIELLINVFSTLLVMYITGKTIEVLIFMVCFVALRSYTGGFHFNSGVMCYIVSTLIVYGSTFVNNLHLGSVVGWIILIASVLIIVALSPVDSMNKPLCRDEKVFFRKIALIVTAAECFFILVLQYIFRSSYKDVVIYAVLLVAIFLILGAVENKRLELKRRNTCT